MVNSTQRDWAIKTLKEARRETDALLDGPNEPTHVYQAWVNSVKRALSTALGADAPFYRDFEALTTVSTASIGKVGVPGSWRTMESRTPPHDVVRQATRLIDDALGALGCDETPTETTGGVAHSSGVSADVRSAPQSPLERDDMAAEAAARVPVALVAYAWDREDHQRWVEIDLAKRLRDRGVSARLDRWEVQPGHAFPAFMEEAIRDGDFVLIVCTPKYKEKADKRIGGVGYESNIMTGESVAGIARKGKFIPILREGDASTAVPSWLNGIAYVNLAGEPGESRYESEFTRLLQTLHGHHSGPPPVGAAPPRPAPSWG